MLFYQISLSLSLIIMRDKPRNRKALTSLGYEKRNFC